MGKDIAIGRESRAVGAGSSPVILPPLSKSRKVQEMGLGCKASKPILSDPLSPVRLHLLNFYNLPKQRSPGDQGLETHEPMGDILHSNHNRSTSNLGDI